MDKLHIAQRRDDAMTMTMTSTPSSNDLY